MGKGKPRKAIEKDGKSENEKVRSLKKALSQRDKEIFRLKAELKTLNEAFRKSADYMSSQSKVLKVEELIKAAQDHQTLEQAKQEYIDEKVSQERERDAIREKWRKWRMENRNGES